MRIAVAGGTGTLGSRVAAELRSRGHEVRVLSRSAPDYPVDLLTGAGLGPALEGCDAVVDASNNAGRQAAAVLVGGTRRLLDAEQAARVRHHVCVSIVGCDQLPVGYYAVKTDQEHLVEQGPVPWTIVRATQFHEYVSNVFGAAARWRGAAGAARAAAAGGVRRGRPVRGGRRAAAGPAGRDQHRRARGDRVAHAGPHLAVGHRRPARADPGPGARPRRPGAALRDADDRAG
jgi:uncharacterized protein YbjT (DUF2867 family)